MNGLLANVVLTVIAFGMMPFCKKAAIEAGSTPGEVAIVTLFVAACVSLLILGRQKPSSLGQLCLLYTSDAADECPAV